MDEGCHQRRVRNDIFLIEGNELVVELVSDAVIQCAMVLEVFFDDLNEVVGEWKDGVGSMYEVVDGFG